MSQHTSLEPISLLFTIIVSGGIVAGLFEGLRNWLARRREEYMDLSKIKMEKVSDALPYYNKMNHYFNSIKNYADHDSKTSNEERRFIFHSREFLFFIGKVLNISDQYFEKFGGMQLDSIEAEEILTHILTEFPAVIRRKLGFKELSLLKNNLVKNGDHDFFYHEFEYTLGFYSELKTKFENEILLDIKTMTELRNLCVYFVDISVFELNHNFRIWYGEDQNYKHLDPQTLRFIMLNYPSYYQRIKSFNKPKLLEPSSWFKFHKNNEELKVP